MSMSHLKTAFFTLVDPFSGCSYFFDIYRPALTLEIYKVAHSCSLPQKTKYNDLTKATGIKLVRLSVSRCLAADHGVILINIHILPCTPHQPIFWHHCASPCLCRTRHIPSSRRRHQS